MAAPNSIQLNQGSGGPKAGTVQDSTSVQHQLVVAEYWSGSGDPTVVSLTNPMPTADQNLGLAQGSTTSGQKGPLMQAAVVSSAAYTVGQTSPCTLDVSGALRVNVVEGSGGGGTQITDGGTFTRGTTSETPTGGVVDSTPPTLTAGKAGAFSLTTSGELRTVVDNGIVAGTAAAPSTALASVVPTAAAGGGASPSCYRMTTTSPAVTTAKAGAGNVYSIVAFNATASIAYLHLYDVSGTVTLGTTSDTEVYPIPANAAGAGYVIPLPVGRLFSNQIAYAVTGGVGATDNSATAASGTSPIVVNVSWK